MSKAIPSRLTGRFLPKPSHFRVPTSKTLDGVSSRLRSSTTAVPSVTPWRSFHDRENTPPLPGKRLEGWNWSRGGNNPLRFPTRTPVSSTNCVFRHASNTVNNTNECHALRLLQYRSFNSDSKGEIAKHNAESSSRSGETTKNESRSAETSSTSKTENDSKEGQDQAAPEAESLTSSVSKYLNLPRMPHRPTKEELLAAATNFRQRLKVRFKWMSIRSMRPWNVDEWGAFVSWFMLGHLVWILVGTTTFFSLVILSINTVFAQGKQHFHFSAILKILTRL